MFSDDEISHAAGATVPDLKLLLPKIYPITDTRLSGLDHAEQVRRLIDAGAELIQIREKSAPAIDLHKAVKDAANLVKNSQARLIVNDRADVALANGVAGLHLGQDDLPPDAARQLLGNEAIIGFSTHSVEQAVAAASLPIDYIAIGPIFPTSSKENPDATVGLAGLNAVCKVVTALPIVAIGGINDGNIVDVFRSGADSAAIIGNILQGDISANFRRLLNIVNNL